MKKNPLLGSQCEIVAANFEELTDNKLNRLLKDVAKNPDFAGFLERFELQNIFKKVALDPVFDTPVEAEKRKQKILPRVVHCLRTPHKNVDSVVVLHAEGNKTAHYKNLQTCGSVWACPVCAPKITEHRTYEITQAAEKWLSIGAEMIMVTYTIPHHFGQNLDELLGQTHIYDKHGHRKMLCSGFKGAKYRLRNQSTLKKRPDIKTWKQLKNDFNVYGVITALETTWGCNGWHVHHHDLYFIDGKITDKRIQDFKDQMIKAWLFACQKVGIVIPNESYFIKHSVDFTRAKSPADYITKWGVIDYDKNKSMAAGWGSAQEITKSHIKTGKNGHFTPWDFARLIYNHPNNRQIYLAFGRLLREYTRIFKGSHQVYWDQGLKEAFDIQNLTDQEIVDQDQKDSKVLAMITKPEWKRILKARLRSKLLIMITYHSIEEIYNVVDLILKHEKNKWPK